MYAFLKKPTWEGNFQIVMINKDQNKPSTEFLLQNPALSDLLGTSGDQELLTEVKILESSSILSPLFNFVKAYKEKKNINNNEITLLIKKYGSKEPDPFCIAYPNLASLDTGVASLLSILPVGKLKPIPI